MKSSFFAWVLEKRYYILAVCTLLLMGSCTLNGLWVGDFWEHAAVVRELAENPVSPGHPILALNLPHAFFSPYLLTVALFARLFHSSPITALAIAGMFNLILLLAALRIFIKQLFRIPHIDFYTLIFMFLLWGSIPWSFSGFFHLRVLNYVLPYPSTFCMALSLLAFSALLIAIREQKLVWYLVVLFAIPVILLSHPYTFIFLGIGLGAIYIGAPGKSRRDLAAMVLVCLIGGGVTLLWPYYPFLKFVLHGASAFQAGIGNMYLHLFQRAWPALVLGVPFIIWRWIKHKLDPLFLLSAGLLVIYIYGYVSGHSAYGRTLSFIIFILHIVIAERTARLEEIIHFKKLARTGSRYLFISLVIIALVILSFRDTLKVGLRNAIPGQPDIWSRYTFFTHYVQPDDVILSDIYTSWFVPVMGGKVVASNNALAFVNDQLERRDAVNFFFSDTAKVAERLSIIHKYNVTMLIFDKKQVPHWQTITTQIGDLAKKVLFSDENFVIWRLPEHTGPTGASGLSGKPA